MPRFLYSSSSKPEIENITSQIDGVKNEFVSTKNFDLQRLSVYYNGVRQITGVSVTILNNSTFRLSFVPTSGTHLLIEYFLE